MLVYCYIIQELAELEARRERVKQNIERIYLILPKKNHSTYCGNSSHTRLTET